MAETDKKVTFELKDLTYDELISSYEEVCEFLFYLESARVILNNNDLKNKVNSKEEIKEIEEKLQESENASAETSENTSNEEQDAPQTSPEKKEEE